MALRRYRVQVNVRGLRAGEHVEIDPKHAHWANYIERGYLVPVKQPADSQTRGKARG